MEMPDSTHKLEHRIIRDYINDKSDKLTTDAHLKLLNDHIAYNLSAIEEEINKLNKRLSIFRIIVIAVSTIYGFIQIIDSFLKLF